jgi:hypothetical protein
MTTLPTRPKVLALDLDGTLLKHEKYPRYGTPLDGWKEELDALRQAGVKIAVWTCRNAEEYDTIRKHLAEHDIEIDYINENPHEEQPSTSPKIYADWYVDDRGVPGFNGDPRGMAAKILKHKPWHKRGAYDD